MSKTNGAVLERARAVFACRCLRALGLALLVLAAPSHRLIAQSLLRVGFGGAAGIASALGDARSGYGHGPIAQGELTLRRAGSALAIRLDAAYLHIRGANAFGVAFPATNVLVFAAGGTARIGPAGRALVPYVLGGAGAYNVQDALPLAPYRTRFGIHAGAGGALRLGQAALFVEARLIHVAGQPSLDILPVVMGLRWVP